MLSQFQLHDRRVRLKSARFHTPRIGNGQDTQRWKRQLRNDSKSAQGAAVTDALRNQWHLLHHVLRFLPVNAPTAGKSNNLTWF